MLPLTGAALLNECEQLRKWERIWIFSMLLFLCAASVGFAGQRTTGKTRMGKIEMSENRNSQNFLSISIERVAVVSEAERRVKRAKRVATRRAAARACLYRAHAIRERASL